MVVFLVEHAYRRALRDHLRVIRIELRDFPDHGLKLNQLVLGDVDEGRIGAHPRRTGGGVDGEYALTGV